MLLWFLRGCSIDVGRWIFAVLGVGCALELLVWNLVSVPLWTGCFIIFLMLQGALAMYCMGAYGGFKTLPFVLSILGALLILWSFHIPAVDTDLSGYYPIEPSTPPWGTIQGGLHLPGWVDNAEQAARMIGYGVADLILSAAVCALNRWLD